MIDFNQFPSPCYIMEEELLRKNLCLIKNVADRAGVEIILAFKYHGRRTFKKEPVFDKKRSRQGGSGDYSCFQVVCHVAFFLLSSRLPCGVLSLYSVNI